MIYTNNILKIKNTKTGCNCSNLEGLQDHALIAFHHVTQPQRSRVLARDQQSY